MAASQALVVRKRLVEIAETLEARRLRELRGIPGRSRRWWAHRIPRMHWNWSRPPACADEVALGSQPA